MSADIRTKAIVTRAVPYKESDMIVTLVSPEYGCITATARGCLKPKAKLRFAAEPMNFGDYLLCGRNGRYIITECSQIESFSTITSDIDKFYTAILVLELLQKLSPEPHAELLMRALEILNSLAYGEDCDADGAASDFMLYALAANGNALDFSHCGVCKCKLEDEAFFSDSAGIVCRHCKDYTCILIDAVSRAYLSGEDRNIPKVLKNKANILLSDFVYNLLGVRVGAHYFTEQL